MNQVNPKITRYSLYILNHCKYNKVPSGIHNNRQLTVIDRTILGGIYTMLTQGKTYYKSNKKIASDIGVSAKTAARSMNKLIIQQWIFAKYGPKTIYGRVFNIRKVYGINTLQIIVYSIYELNRIGEKHEAQRIISMLISDQGHQWMNDWTKSHMSETFCLCWAKKRRHPQTNCPRPLIICLYYWTEIRRGAHTFHANQTQVTGGVHTFHPNKTEIRRGVHTFHNGSTQITPGAQKFHNGSTQVTPPSNESQPNRTILPKNWTLCLKNGTLCPKSKTICLKKWTELLQNIITNIISNIITEYRRRILSGISSSSSLGALRPGEAPEDDEDDLPKPSTASGVEDKASQSNDSDNTGSTKKPTSSSAGLSSSRGISGTQAQSPSGQQSSKKKSPAHETAYNKKMPVKSRNYSIMTHYLNKTKAYADYMRRWHHAGASQSIVVDALAKANRNLPDSRYKISYILKYANACVRNELIREG